MTCIDPKTNVLNVHKKLQSLFRKKKYAEYIQCVQEALSSNLDNDTRLILLDKLINVYIDLDNIEELKALYNHLQDDSRRLKIKAKLLNYEGKYNESYECLLKIKEASRSCEDYEILFLVYVIVSIAALCRKIKGKDWFHTAINNLKEAEILINSINPSDAVYDYEIIEAKTLISYEFSLNTEEYGDLATARKYMIQSKELIDKIKFSPVFYSVLNLQITILNVIGNTKQLKEFAKKALDMNSLYGLTDVELIDIYNNIGRALTRNKEYSYALTYFNKAIDIIKNKFKTNVSRVSFVYNNLGLCYLYSKNYSKALECFYYDLKCQYEKDNSYNAACGAIYNNIGKTYYEMKKMREAEEAFLKSLQIHQIFYDNPSAVYNNLAKLYLEWAHKDVSYINKAKEYTDLDDSVRNHIFSKDELLSLLTKLKIFIFTKEYQEAINIIKFCIKNVKSYSGNDIVSEYDDLLILLEQICHQTVEDVELHNKCENLYFKTVKDLDTVDNNKEKYICEIIADVYDCNPIVSDSHISFEVERNGQNEQIIIMLSNNKRLINSCINFLKEKSNQRVTVITNRLFRYMAYGQLENANIILVSDYKDVIGDNCSIYEYITLGIFKNGDLPDPQLWELKNAKIINNLRAISKTKKINLFLGAGASVNDGGKTWEQLINLLFRENINLAAYIDIGERRMTLEDFVKNSNLSPLALGRYLANNISDFNKRVHEILYQNEINFSSESILNFIATHIKYFKDIVTYNYDDYLEQYFDYYKIKYEVVSDNRSIKNTPIPHIYHVHGYLPHNTYKMSSIVWKEEDYHELYNEFDSWNNKIQLLFLKNDVNIFIGHSLTDPNLRRLLDISVMERKNTKKESSIYVFMRDQPINSTFRLMQENLASQMDFKIIWIQEFDEILKIMKRIFD